jgi:choice-of-anchor B domain-containing protein
MVAAALAPAGDALAFQSWNTELLAQVHDYTEGRYSSCWGYTDPNTGAEYAIIGAYVGAAFYNITDPRNPTLAGFIPGPPNGWREMKTYREWCYIVTEGNGPGEGLQIVSLADPETPTLVATYTATFTDAHTVTIDSVNAKLYANGADGGMHILSLADPIAPVELGVYADTYVHDSYVRDDTCYASCIQIGKLIILDTSNPAVIDTLKRFSWPLSAVHNSWPTEDANFLLTTDETQSGMLRSWDISDFANPVVQLDQFIADPTSDVHNVHVRGDLAYVAHYRDGLHVLDISNPADLRPIAFLDTYQGTGLFDGAWGAYNYFPSGNVVVSDMYAGLFVIDHWEDAGAISGAVTSAATAQPIPYAQVRLLDTARDFAVNGAGAFLVDAEPGGYSLRARAFGFDSSTVAVAVATGDTLAQNFALMPLPGAIVAGTVVRAAGGTPIAGAAVSFAGTPIAPVTNASGAFTTPNFPAGSWKAIVDEFSYQPDSLVAVVAAGAPDTLAFSLVTVDFKFNFEDTSATGWQVNVDATDNAIGGFWIRGNPPGTYVFDSVPVQPEDDHTRGAPLKCWHTGAGGGPPIAGDVDGGRTTLYSPVIDLTTVPGPIVSFWRWYSNDADGSPADDSWRAQISSNGGATWVTVDSTSTTASTWTEVRFLVQQYVQPTATMRMRFIAEDAGGESLVEAAVDDFRIWGIDGATDVAIGGDGAAPDPAFGDTGGAAALALRLHPGHPNPMRAGAGGGTEFRFELPSSGIATLELFGVDGRRVARLASRAFAAGEHRLAWNGADDAGRRVASGLYVCRLTAAGRSASQKVLIVE